MNDSELNVNAGSAADSQSFMSHRGSVRNVATTRDDAVSRYIRSRLEEMDSQPKGWQLALARAGKLAPSTVAQVKSGTGVGAKTIPGFAKALGFKSADDLKSAAYRWWETEGRLLSAAQAAATGAKPPTAVAGDAVEAVLGLYPSATRELLEGILVAFSHERFATRDRSWWIRVLIDELQLEEKAEGDAFARRLDAQRASSSSRPPPRKRSTTRET